MSMITLDLQENRSVRVNVGDLLEVCLIEQTSGGYLWSVAGALPDGITEIGERRDHGRSGIGAPTTKIFLFSCDSEFTGEVRFSLARPWTPDQVEQTRTLSIVCVRG